jgi:hypothetical protein
LGKAGLAWNHLDLARSRLLVIAKGFQVRTHVSSIPAKDARIFPLKKNQSNETIHTFIISGYAAKMNPSVSSTLDAQGRLVA